MPLYNPSSSSGVTAGQLPATATNDSASAGNLGEFISAHNGTPFALTSGVNADCTSISLTAGDWDLRGVADFSGGATTTLNSLGLAIGTVSTGYTANAGTTNEHNHNYNGTTTFSAGGDPQISVGPCRLSLSTTTTVYLVVRPSFGTSTCSMNAATLEARRVR